MADQHIISKATAWLNSNIDEASKSAIRKMLDNPDSKELEDAFYRDLEFGTGGLRGIMGIGSNRMNKYTVAMATQGLANYLLATYPGEEIRVAITHDCRINNTLFADTTAHVFAANGIKVFYFKELRPTPMLSFAIRQLKCHSGVMVTASHNPKEYNGYKAYWNDGGQIVAPHDKNIIAEVQKITDISMVKMSGNESAISYIGEEMDALYLKMVKSLSLSPSAVTKHKDLKIVFSPIHGATGKMVPAALRAFGFENIHLVKEQEQPDGNFPTVIYPNPEEAEALTLAIKLAEKVDADIVMACDPDGDRLAIVAKNKKGAFEILNGNQTAAILTYYLIQKWKENGKLKGKEFTVSTIVTSEILEKISAGFGVPCYVTLTGFKNIAAVIREKEAKETYIGGGEESYGYMIGDQVRDKDGVSACAMMSEITAWAKTQGKDLFDILADIYTQFGFYKESLISLTKKGKDGAEEIQRMMQNFRENMPEEIAGQKVIRIIDVKKGTDKDILSGKVTPLTLESSNVLQFYLSDGSKISARPSGTEPKIKFYISVNAPLQNANDYDKVANQLDERIERLKVFLDQ